MPYGATATGDISVTVALALLTFCMGQIAGIKSHGLFGYAKGLIPPGLPVFILPIMIPVEIISLFTKHFALAIRLFANMAAGHVMLSLLLLSAWVFLGSLPTGNVSGAWGLLWAGLGLFIYLFEILVAVLQAYIFTLLSAVYIQTSVEVEAH